MLLTEITNPYTHRSSSSCGPIIPQHTQECLYLFNQLLAPIQVQHTWRVAIACRICKYVVWSTATLVTKLNLWPHFSRSAPLSEENPSPTHPSSRLQDLCFCYGYLYYSYCCFYPPFSFCRAPLSGKQTQASEERAIVSVKAYKAFRSAISISSRFLIPSRQDGVSG